MLLIHCPYCEEDRSELEFHGAGEAHIVRPHNMAEISDDEFAEYFFMRNNEKGVTWERWRHQRGCGRFFNAVRDTVSDRFLMTYKAGLPKQAVPSADAAQAIAEEKTVETYEATEGDAR
ncbi:MAG: sarcosine oxidase subunit delta [Neorhizobium sp.]|jgi:sarcosine oxidase subunit delta|nr:sarcosine oxidase subunit delta [Neorhizobium sp.]